MDEYSIIITPDAEKYLNITTNKPQPVVKITDTEVRPFLGLDWQMP